MRDKKYELTKETKVSNPGWVCENAKVYDNARMYYGEAKVFGDDRNLKVRVPGMLRRVLLLGCAIVLGCLVLFGFIN